MIIAGGRDFEDFDLLEKEVKLFLKGKRPSEIEIVSGAADGADTLGEDFAKKYKCKLHRKRANWTKYGNAAGPIRNKEMAIYASQGETKGGCICFWDGKSKGTKNMIGLAKKYGLELKVIMY